MAHKHAENMVLYAEDAKKSETPWELWEFKQEGGSWEKLQSHPAWVYHYEYRSRKPIKIKIGQYEINAPLRTLKQDQLFFVANIYDLERSIQSIKFSNYYNPWLENGICFKTAEDALLAAKAILSLLNPTKTKPCPRCNDTKSVVKKRFPNGVIYGTCPECCGENYEPLP